MIVQLGNVAAQAAGQMLDHGEPCVTTMNIPDDYTHEEGADAGELMRHLVANPSVRRLPGHEAFVAVVDAWGAHSTAAPAWVYSDNDDLERLLSEFWQCARGVPDDVEDTHHTRNGPPGVGSDAEASA